MSLWEKAKGAIVGGAVGGPIGGLVGGVGAGGVFNALSGGAGYDTQGYTYDESSQQAHADFEAELAQQYRDQIEGKTPSLAQAQLADATQRAQQSQLAMARSGTGPLGGQAAQMGAARNMAGQQSQAARDASMLRAQEYQAAVQGGSQLAQNALQREQSYQLGKSGDHYQGQAIAAGAHEARAGRRQQTTTGLMGAGGTIGGAVLGSSDSRVKTDVQQEDPNELDKFIEDLTAYRYRYKNGDPREHVGVMAQDVEASPVGEGFVVENEQGVKGFDENGFGTALAAIARLGDRIKKLEGGKS
jgi:hypothetical protein